MTILEAVQKAGVTVKPVGEEYVGLCPFHTDIHPSFYVLPEKGMAVCFACQWVGDSDDFNNSI